MRHLVFADVHGNLPALERVLAQREALDAHHLVFLGDAIGYNGFPEECAARLREHDVQAIKGNHEALFLGELPFSTCTNPLAPHTLKITRSLLSTAAVAYLKSLPERALLNDRALLVHGSLRSIDEYVDQAEKVRANLERLRRTGSRIAFFAHTHRPAIYSADLELRQIRSVSLGERLTLRDDRCYLINPGTAGEPRYNLPLSFLVYDDESSQVEFVSFVLSAREKERVRRRNREVFGAVKVIAAINQGFWLGRRLVSGVRQLVRRISP